MNQIRGLDLLCLGLFALVLVASPGLILLIGIPYIEINSKCVYG